MNIKFKKLSAFSLAELLIMLGVLSVLAMVAVPLLNSKKTTALAIKFKKEYSYLEYFVSNLISESGYYRPDKGFADTTPVAGEGTTNKFCYWLKDSISIQRDYGCPGMADAGTKLFAQATDETLWYFYPAAFTVSVSNFDNKVIVDVNGNKKPNCFSNTKCATYKPAGYSCGCSKPDTYVIGVRYDGKLNVDNDEVAKKILLNQEKF